MNYYYREPKITGPEGNAVSINNTQIDWTGGFMVQKDTA